MPILSISLSCSFKAFNFYKNKIAAHCPACIIKSNHRHHMWLEPSPEPSMSDILPEQSTKFNCLTAHSDLFYNLLGLIEKYQQIAVVEKSSGQDSSVDLWMALTSTFAAIKSNREYLITDSWTGKATTLKLFYSKLSSKDDIMCMCIGLYVCVCLCIGINLQLFLLFGIWVERIIDCLLLKEFYFRVQLRAASLSRADFSSV